MVGRCWTVSLPDGTPYRVHAERKPTPEAALAIKEVLDAARDQMERNEREVREIRRDWVGSERMEHFCHGSFTHEDRHAFWIPQIFVNGEKMTCGHKEDGDDQRADCTVDLAKFTNSDAARRFAQHYLDGLERDA